MSIDDRLRETAQAVEGLWTDPAETSRRYAKVRRRVLEEGVIDRNSGAGERPLTDIDFLTVSEVAVLMGVTKLVVYRLVHSGELPSIRVGRSFRVPESAVLAYLDEVDMADING